MTSSTVDPKLVVEPLGDAESPLAMPFGRQRLGGIENVADAEHDFCPAGLLHQLQHRGQLVAEACRLLVDDDEVRIEGHRRRQDHAGPQRRRLVDVQVQGFRDIGAFPGLDDAGHADVIDARRER